MNFIPLGWPKKKVRLEKPEIIYRDKLYYLGKFFRRNINIILNSCNYQIEKKWYLNKKLASITAGTFLEYNFLKIYLFKLPVYFLFIILLFKKKKIIVTKKNEIVLFGPFSFNYAHQMHEFLVRISYLNSYRFHTIYLPHYLKKIISSKIYKKIFSHKKFIFYNANQTISFFNISYISHVENRFFNPIFYKTLNFLRTKTINLNKKNQKKKEYLFISRKNSDQRKLINEDALFHELKKIGFKRVFFEKISVDNQIKLSNSCKIMIGYHGAGLSNCAYMNKNTFLIEICNKFYPHPHFELFCKILKIRYKRFFCVKNYKNLNGVCNVTEILNYITSIKKNGQS
jgi:hypothetical protein